MTTNEALELAARLEGYKGRQGISATVVANYMNNRPDYEDVSRDEREAARCAMEQLQRLGLAKITGNERGWSSGTRLHII